MQRKHEVDHKKPDFFTVAFLSPAFKIFLLWVQPKNLLYSALKNRLFKGPCLKTEVLGTQSRASQSRGIAPKQSRATLKCMREAGGIC